MAGPDGLAGRHLIRSREFKAATDEDGNHESGGLEREVPWVAITPVVNAVRVLERMVPDGYLLFDHHAHDLHARPGTGSLKPSVLRRRIESFAAWANQEAARLGLPGEAVPADPHGNIGTSRFRRSLAWHIARRPNGLVALAIQYGHMRTAFDFGHATEGTPPAAATASTTSSTWKPPARSPTPSPPCTTTSQTAAASPAPQPAAPSRPPPPHPASPAPPSPSPALASCWPARTP